MDLFNGSKYYIIHLWFVCFCIYFFWEKSLWIRVVFEGHKLHQVSIFSFAAYEKSKAPLQYKSEEERDKINHTFVILWNFIVYRSGGTMVNGRVKSLRHWITKFFVLNLIPQRLKPLSTWHVNQLILRQSQQLILILAKESLVAQFQDELKTTLIHTHNQMT